MKKPLVLLLLFTYSLLPALDNSTKQKTFIYKLHKIQKNFKAKLIKSKYSIKKQYSLMH